MFGHVLAARGAGDRPLDVFIAGDDAEAKARVAAFAESLALRPLDVGGLAMAHWLEGASLLEMRLAIGGPSRTASSPSPSTSSADRVLLLTPRSNPQGAVMRVSSPARPAITARSSSPN
jgi:predicted dinucleotide-binding enzyme